jgi:hypothetical protein
MAPLIGASEAALNEKKNWNDEQNCFAIAWSWKAQFIRIDLSRDSRWDILDFG